jgi:Uma2 family endonuclease
MSFDTVADLLDELHVPAERIRLKPAPGTATGRDVLRIKAREGVLCELVNGTLVEKSMGFNESAIPLDIAYFFKAYLRQNNLGFLSGADGPIRMRKKRIRIPDFAFYSWRHFPDRKRPQGGIPAICPDLAVEIISPKNTRREMARKLKEYFAAGTQIVWYVYPKSKTVDVYTTPTTKLTVGPAETLDGGDLLPGLAVPVAAIFE